MRPKGRSPRRGSAALGDGECEGRDGEREEREHDAWQGNEEPVVLVRVQLEAKVFNPPCFSL